MAQLGTTYGKHRAYADSEYDALAIPSDCTETLKLIFTPVNDVAWSSRWYLEFTDGKYIRAVERFQRWPGLTGIAKRMTVAYHYGDIVRRNPDDNLPGYLSAGTDQVDIRIDNICMPIHLHYQSQNPHIPQSSVIGLDLESVDMFIFVKGIFKHRATKKLLESIFKFKIR
jgi:hypothetical protein